MIPFGIITVKRRIRFMMYDFERLAFSHKLLILLILGALLWFFGGLPSSTEKTVTAEIEQRAVQQHVAHYCNYPMRAFGSEGSLSLEKLLKESRFQLEMAQVVIRHGDRAPAVVITNMDNAKYDYDCTFRTTDVSHRELFEDYKESTKYFRLRKFVPSAKDVQPLVPTGGTCQYAQLTQRGFLQHFELGMHLRKAYSSLINNDIQSVMVRSTERERCVQSAAAFLYGLLTRDTIKKEGLTINITTDAWFREDDKGVPYKCPSLPRIQNQYKQRRDYITKTAEMEPFMQEYAQLLRVPRASLTTITYLTDAVYTRYCHKHPLPCGPGGCVSKEMAAKAMDFASWAFAENYTPIAQAAAHPMLIQMAKRMINKVQDQSTLKFMLYSGHDSTITPLLLNLGVHDRKKWLPYATFVALELWRDTLPDSTRTADPINNYYIRLLVNGKVMTSKLTFCKEALYKGELCPLQELILWLSGSLGIQEMDERYRQLCS